MPQKQPFLTLIPTGVPGGHSTELPGIQLISPPGAQALVDILKREKAVAGRTPGPC